VDKNTKTLTLVLGVVAGMIGLSFASVPLYKLFCQVTGFDGTTMRSTALPDKVLDRKMEIRFNADTSPDLPWTFKPDQHKVTVNIGQEGLVSYQARNDTAQPTTGTAVYNVTPEKAGKYFQKIQCFCFGEQLLQPNEEIHMPVVFFVDPKMADDPEMDDVTTITLSYTFFRSESEELDKALEEFYNAPKD
jgi:cytochrome c oxidase assembly protein subunit 11